MDDVYSYLVCKAGYCWKVVGREKGSSLGCSRLARMDVGGFISYAKKSASFGSITFMKISRNQDMLFVDKFQTRSIKIEMAFAQSCLVYVVYIPILNSFNLVFEDAVSHWLVD